MPGCAKPSHHLQPLPSSLAAHAPQSSQPPLPTAAGEPRASGWGTAGVFDYCVSWPTVRWAGARKMNWCKESSQTPGRARLLPSSASAERTGGLRSLRRGRGKGHSFSTVLQGTYFTGVYCSSSSSSLPLELFVLLQDQPLFPNSHTHTLIITIIIKNPT